MTNDRKNRVFLSYAREDQDRVRQVYEGLIKRGLNVWLDKESSGPGKWLPQITKAIARSRYFVICLSQSSISKTGDKPGFLDEELNMAYNIAMNQPVTEFSIIPLRLEDCDRGDHRLTMFQQYDLHDDFNKGLDKLALDLGGVALADVKPKDQRTEDQKLIDDLFAKSATEYYAGKLKESIEKSDIVYLAGQLVEQIINQQYGEGAVIFKPQQGITGDSTINDYLTFGTSEQLSEIEAKISELQNQLSPVIDEAKAKTEPLPAIDVKNEIDVPFAKGIVVRPREVARVLNERYATMHPFLQKIIQTIQSVIR
jgi:hypothetical protein